MIPKRGCYSIPVGTYKVARFQTCYNHYITSIHFSLWKGSTSTKYRKIKVIWSTLQGIQLGTSISSSPTRYFLIDVKSSTTGTVETCDNRYIHYSLIEFTEPLVWSHSFWICNWLGVVLINNVNIHICYIIVSLPCSYLPSVELYRNSVAWKHADAWWCDRYLIN
jgi:hypothetical protein